MKKTAILEMAGIGVNVLYITYIKFTAITYFISYSTYAYPFNYF